MGNLFGSNLVKSISFDEGEILRNINELHCKDWFELDPCYSVGRFYEAFGIPQPKYKFDLEPKAKGVQQASAEKLPFENGTINSIMFDPPFLATSGKSYNTDKRRNGHNVIINRFSAFPSMASLWRWYYDCLKEFKRILNEDGILVFKNQDCVSSGKQYFSHCYIMAMALEIGFYPKDLFILLAKNRVLSGKHNKQQHARKFHCYYWVFENKKSLVEYDVKKIVVPKSKKVAQPITDETL